MKNYILLDTDFCGDFQLSVINRDSILIFDEEYHKIECVIERLNELHPEYKTLICSLDRNEYDKLRKVTRKQHSLHFHFCHIEDIFDADDLAFKSKSEMSIFRFYRELFDLQESRNKHQILSEPRRTPFIDMFTSSPGRIAQEYFSPWVDMRAANDDSRTERGRRAHQAVDERDLFVPRYEAIRTAVSNQRQDIVVDEASMIQATSRLPSRNNTPFHIGGYTVDNASTITSSTITTDGQGLIRTIPTRNNRPVRVVFDEAAFQRDGAPATNLSPSDPIEAGRGDLFEW